MPSYTPAEIEAKWQAAWAEAGLFAAERDLSKPKYYVLEMFPYPSGKLHMGHVRNYTMGDVIARYKRATGHNVLHPMGFDAFGMPAENAAMASGGHPKDWTYANIDTMVAQMKPLGFSLDWSRMFATCDPEYYGQKQTLFLDMLEAGLVYMADELRSALDGLDAWPAKVRLMQENWIGKSRGIELPFQRTDGGAPILCFSTRPDPMRGATFLAISPAHPLAKSLEAERPDLASFIEACRKMDTTEAAMEKAEKVGVDTGIRVRHPVLEGEELQVWIGNFVLMDYGTGAIYGCPAHDQRDFDFAKKYGLPVRNAFYMEGGIDEVIAKAEKLAAEAA